MLTIFRSETIRGIPCTRKVRSSKNLRGIVEHNRINGKPKAHIVNLLDGSAIVGLEWPNGDLCNVTFASAYVAWRWFERRASTRTQE